MKHSTILLTLLSIASTLEYKLENKLLERDTNVQYFNDATVQCEPDNNDCEDLYINYEDELECKKNFDSYYEKCRYAYVDYENKEEMDYLCERNNSSYCEDFFNLSIDTLPGCKEMSSAFLENYIKIKEDTKLALSLKCSKDDEDEYCPISKFDFYTNSRERGFRTINIDVEDTEFIKAIHQSCESKKCFSTAIQALSYYKDNGKVTRKKLSEDENEDDFEVLKSNFCHLQIEDILDEIVKKHNTEQTIQNNMNNESLLLSNDSTKLINNIYILFASLIVFLTLHNF